MLRYFAGFTVEETAAAMDLAQVFAAHPGDANTPPFNGHVDPRRHPAGPRRMVGGLDFSPDGRFIATASREGTVRIWEAGSWSRRVLSVRADRLRQEDGGPP